MKQRNPWTWSPTLYIAEGLPNVVVMTVAVVMYMQLGLSDTDIALYTGWLGLPWVIKPLWSPFVDLYRTKRWWVLTMQLLLGSSLAGVAFTLNAPFWFQGSMAFFFLMAFSSATHDIAADGYYTLDVSLSGVAEVFVTKDDYDPKSTLNNSRDTAYYMFAQAGIVVTLCGKRIRPVVSKPQK